MKLHSLIPRINLPAAIACTIAFACAACAAAGQYPLIMERQCVPPEVSERIQADEGLRRAAKRIVKVDLLDRLSAEDMISADDVLVLNLFDDAHYRASVECISKNVQDTVSIRGRLESFSSGYVVISSNRGRSMAHIRIPEENREYVIFYDSETEAHYLIDIDPAAKETLPGAPPMHPERE
ncbi:MAG: hypothetical protein R6T92_04765 [Desulfosalsimonadaceae bacterium]